MRPKSSSIAARISCRRSPAAGCMIGNIRRPSTCRSRPRTRLMLCPGRKRAIENRPSVTMSSGSISSIWRSRYLRQAAISPGIGSRLLGGRHLTILAIYTCSRDIPMDCSSSSRKLPAGPTKGRPWRSSCAPGPSPMNSSSASAGPSPGTAWVRPACSGQSVQLRTSPSSSASVSILACPQPRLCACPGPSDAGRRRLYRADAGPPATRRP